MLALAELQLDVFLRYHVGAAPYPRPTPMPPVSSGTLPRDLPAMLATAFAAAGRQHPGAGVAVIRLVVRVGVPKALVTLAGPDPRSLAFDARSGAPIADDATSGRQAGNGYFADWHQVVKRLHRGDIPGWFAGRYVDIAAGLSIAWLVLSGAVMFIEQLARRRRAGRRGLFWR